MHPGRDESLRVVPRLPGMGPEWAWRSTDLTRVVAGLVVAVVVGLLGMHTLDLGGTEAGVAGATSERSGATHHAAAVSDDADAASTAHGCATCEASGHLAMTAACVLLLLAVGLALTAPGIRPAWLHERAPAVDGRPPRSGMPSRAPSLHALCISRT